MRVGLSERHRFGPLVGHSVAMREVFHVLERCTKSDATVLITGETGTGKEGAAEGIHEESARADGPFVIIDCGSIPPSLLESELFGHERGAFTGAVSARIGAFEQASGGTVFLDEIGELPPDLQPKLLRVLEQKTIRRVGGTDRVDVDVRVVAATRRALEAEVNLGTFRSDLYYRLAVLRAHLPPLRERIEDLPFLVEALLERLAPSDEERERLTSRAFLQRLQAASWPGNVRELRNALERALVFEGDAELAVAAPSDPALVIIDPRLGWAEARQLALGDFERRYLAALLAQHEGNVTQAARAAGLDRVYLHRLLRRHGLRG
jgi:DNA-binding NtrC family response regulator